MPSNEGNDKKCDEGISQQIRALFQADSVSLTNSEKGLELFAKDMGLEGEITEGDFQAVPKTFSDRLGSALEERFSGVDSSLTGKDLLRARAKTLLDGAKARAVKKE